MKPLTSLLSFLALAVSCAAGPRVLEGVPSSEGEHGAPGAPSVDAAEVAAAEVAPAGQGAAVQDAAPGAVPSPAEHLGRPVGTDFELADWEETSSYYRRLAKASDRVLLRELGTTSEGREFLEAVISSPENLAQLDRIQRRNRMLADPRGWGEEALREAVQEAPVVLAVSCSMHSTEVAGTEFGMEFAWRLATSDEEPYRTARERCVVVLFPTLNPDGLDEVVHWYRRTVGTEYEASSLLRLYQLYTGHDNNRDWFMLTQQETKLVTRELYQRWFPQVYWDVHQQGSTRERFFVPPFRDPLNPNLDPAIITGIDALGSRALHDLTAAGFTGVSTGVSYDMWWNGGNRNVPVRHNVIGLLTEAASADLATPLFLQRGDLSAPRGLGAYAPSNRFPSPWPGGWWRVGDIIRYELGFGESLLGSLSREPSLWRANQLAASRRTIEEGQGEGVRGWVLPRETSDPDAAARLVQVVLDSGLEVHRLTEDWTASGRTWPAGTLVLRRDQPFGAHLQDLMELQDYPEGDPPYDVAGWTLPSLLGVRRVAVFEPLPEGCERVEDRATLGEAFAGDPRVGGFPKGWLSGAHSSSWSRAAQLLAKGEPVTWIGAGERAGLFVPGTDVANTDEQPQVLRRLPRIGLYAPWSGFMPEGWMRWVLDTWRIPYRTVRNEDLRAGRLDEIVDVLLLPGNSSGQLNGGRSEGTIMPRYAGGLDPEGAVAVEEFVRGGGRLVTCGASSAWAIDLLRLPLVDVTAEADAFSCPGSVLRAVPEPSSWTRALPPSVTAFFSRSAAWRMMSRDEREESGRDGAATPEVLLRFAPSRVLVSGWIQGEEVLEGQAAWVRARHGEGSVHLFGFQPQYRGWSQQAFGLLFRALLLGGTRG